MYHGQRTLRAALILICSWGSTAATQGKSDFTGTWTMEFKSPDGTTQKKTMAFYQEGEKVFGTEFTKKKIVDGKVDDNKLTFKNFSTRFGQTESFGDLSVTTDGKTLTGTWTVGDKKVEWKGVKLPSVWVCGNHADPAHSATSSDEMKQLTKAFQCAGWHKLESASSISSFLKEKE